MFVVAVAGVSGAAPIAEGAIINAANPRRVKTAATVRIAATTSGQRLILVKIDPPITTGFKLDVAYPAELVEPLGVGNAGFGAAVDLSGAITFFAPYQGLGGGISTLTIGLGGSGGVISNVEGRYVGNAFAAGLAPQANREDGGSDLFELAFVDLAPELDKTFTVLGVDPTGIDPLYEPFIRDNYLNIFVGDPANPTRDDNLHYAGDQIESFSLVVPGVANDNGASGVPLPPAVFAGALSVGAAWFARRRFVR